MIKLERQKPGDDIQHIKWHNMLVDAIDEQRQAQPGPGLSKTPDGRLYSTGNKRRVEEAQNEDDGSTTTTLAITQATQDTDTWAFDAGAKVAVQFISDIQYDTTSHKLQMRFRTLTINAAGRVESISAEGALVDITEAVACTKV